MSNEWIRRLTPTLLAGVGAGGAGCGVQWSTSATRSAWAALTGTGGSADRVVEHAVVLLCAATLTVVLGWLVLGVLVCSIDAARHGWAEPSTAGRGGLLRPRLARMIVTAVVGAAVASSSGAAATADSSSPPLPHALDGLPLPDRPYGGVRTHRVEAGESLWSITADHVPERAVSRAWPRLHRLNRDRLGRDPDVIHPGTTLRLPPWATVPTRGATR